MNPFPQTEVLDAQTSLSIALGGLGNPLGPRSPEADHRDRRDSPAVRRRPRLA